MAAKVSPDGAPAPAPNLKKLTGGVMGDPVFEPRKSSDTRQNLFDPFDPLDDELFTPAAGRDDDF